MKEYPKYFTITSFNALFMLSDAVKQYNIYSKKTTEAMEISDYASFNYTAGVEHGRILLLQHLIGAELYKYNDDTGLFEKASEPCPEKGII